MNLNSKTIFLNFVNEAQWGAYVQAKELSERNKKALYFTLVALFFFTAFLTKDPSFSPLCPTNYVASPEHSVNMKLAVSK